MAGNKWICYSISDEDLHGRWQGCAEHVVVHSRLRRLWRHGTRSVASSSSAVTPRRRARPAARPPRLRNYSSSSSLLGYHAGTMYQGYQVSSISRYQGTRYWYLPIPGYRYQRETKHGLKEVDLAWMLGNSSPLILLRGWI
uniref:Uncharacterized protein n=1 Tax=Oryza nivara TaxID=4536 RepID=A0A0E0HL19_ORYNI